MAQTKKATGFTTSVKAPKVTHSDRAHALLSPSSAKQWLSCPPSAVLKDKYGKSDRSVYADEGTLAHEISEIYLRKNVLGILSEEQFDSLLSQKTANELYTDDMIDNIQLYVNYCRDTYISEKTQNGSAIMEVETKLDMSKYAPGSFGTADCVVISKGVMEVIDLKYGKGVAVSAEHNEQLMMYGLGAYEFFSIMYPIDTIRMTIVQPRLENISTFEMSREDLLKWAEEVLVPGAKLALSGEGDAVAGEWCKFCSVKARCRAYAEANTEPVLKHDFCDPRLLSDDEIAIMLLRAPEVAEWAKSVQAYAEDEAINHGKEWPGFKIVEGRSIRKWADDVTAYSEILKRFPTLTAEQICKTKLNGIGDIEKLVSKKVFKEQLSDLVIKPQGSPTLVPNSDKRPPMGTLENAVKAFDGIEI